MNAIFDILGKRVKAKRMKLGLSQEELSMLVGIDRTELNAIETGKGNPKLKTVESIAAHLDASVAELLSPKAQDSH